MMPDNETLIVSDIREEARRLATACVDLGLAARLIGGLAIWLRCPSVRTGPFARSYQDMDFAVSSGSGHEVQGAARDAGIPAGPVLQRPARRDPPVLPGAGRTLVDRRRHRRAGDVAQARPSRTPRGARADGHARGPAAHQAAGLGDQPQGPRRRALPARRSRAQRGRRGSGRCEPAPPARGARQGLGVLPHVRAQRAQGRRALGAGPGAERGAQRRRPGRALLQAVEEAPKSRAWRLRSRVGERLRWYETPEEVRH